MRHARRAVGVRIGVKFGVVKTYRVKLPDGSERPIEDFRVVWEGPAGVSQELPPMPEDESYLYAPSIDGRRVTIYATPAGSNLVDVSDFRR